MYNKVYEKKEFIIFQVKNGYIAYNTKKSFKDGHTHLRCFESAKTAIDLVIRRKVPRSTDLYYLTSLIRLSGDHVYISKIKELIKYRQEKINRQNYEKSKTRRKNGKSVCRPCPTRNPIPGKNLRARPHGDSRIGHYRKTTLRPMPEVALFWNV